MEITQAKVEDANAIHSLITSHAERDKMLFRSLADIYDNMQTFQVARIDGAVVGCCAVQIIWEDLAEIKSLAIEKQSLGKGVGRELVLKAVDTARCLGIKKVFALTLESAFFEKIGFKKIPKERLPMKVWSDCARCPKQDHCDETAVMFEVK